MRANPESPPPADFEPDEEFEAWTIDELDGPYGETSLAAGTQAAYASYDD